MRLIFYLEIYHVVVSGNIFFFLEFYLMQTALYADDRANHDHTT